MSRNKLLIILMLISLIVIIILVNAKILSVDGNKLINNAPNTTFAERTLPSEYIPGTPFTVYINISNLESDDCTMSVEEFVPIGSIVNNIEPAGKGGYNPTIGRIAWSDISGPDPRCGGSLDYLLNYTIVIPSSGAKKFNGEIGITKGPGGEYAYRENAIIGDTLISSLLIPIDGICSSNVNECLNGTLEDISDSSTQYLWNCLGAGGGQNVSCSKNIGSSSSSGSSSGSSGGSSSSSSSGSGVINTTNATGNNQTVYQQFNQTANLTTNQTSNVSSTNVSGNGEQEEGDKSGKIAVVILIILVIAIIAVILYSLLKTKNKAPIA